MREGSRAGGIPWGGIPWGGVPWGGILWGGIPWEESRVGGIPWPPRGYYVEHLFLGISIFFYFLFIHTNIFTYTE